MMAKTSSPHGRYSAPYTNTIFALAPAPPPSYANRKNPK
jgi:hypothetical protein